MPTRSSGHPGLIPGLIPAAPVPRGKRVSHRQTNPPLEIDARATIEGVDPGSAPGSSGLRHGRPRATTSVSLAGNIVVSSGTTLDRESPPGLFRYVHTSG